MAVVYEEFVRCECGNPHFVEEKHIVVHQKATRMNETTLLTPLESMVVYKCSDCGKKLNK